MIDFSKDTASSQGLNSVNGVDPAVYGEDYYRDIDRGSESMSHPGLAAIQRLAQHSRRILDCGCGEGGNLSRIGAPDALRTGVEWSEEGVRRASLRPGLKVVRADIRRMPFPDGVFDFVFSAYVLEHTTEPTAVVAEMIRVLAPGGRLALLCPNYGSPFFCSPCSRANPWWRAIRLALRDIFIGWRSRRALLWEPVAPIATAGHWSSDWDTTVEPALIPLLHHLRSRAELRVVQADSFWRPPSDIAPDAPRIKRLKHLIRSAVANSPLCRLPWVRYWGLDLFVVLEKGSHVGKSS